MNRADRRTTFVLTAVLILALLTWAVLATVVGNTSAAGARQPPRAATAKDPAASSWVAGARAILLPTDGDNRTVLVASCGVTEGRSAGDVHALLRDIGLHPERHPGSFSDASVAKGSGTRAIVVPPCHGLRGVAPAGLPPRDAIAVFGPDAALHTSGEGTSYRAKLTVPAGSGADVVVVARCDGPGGGDPPAIRTLPAPPARHGRDVLVVGRCAS